MDNVFDEPEVVYPEAEFQQTLVKVLEAILGPVRHVLLQSFGVDVALFVEIDGATRVRFFEIKSFAGQRPDGVGFGNGKGEGPQVDLLLNSDAELRMFDSCIRWVLARQFDRKPRPLRRGEPRYAIFNCREAKAAAMAGVGRGKQNNLKVSAFDGCLIGWSQLLSELRAFVLGGVASDNGPDA